MLLQSRHSSGESCLLLTAGERAWDKNSQSPPRPVPAQLWAVPAMAPNVLRPAGLCPPRVLPQQHSEPCSALHPLSFRDLQFPSLGCSSSPEQGHNSKTRGWLSSKGITAKLPYIADSLSTATPRFLCKFIQNFDFVLPFYVQKESCCFFPRITGLPQT